ncbi:TPA: hypothetical protein DCZ15_01420 [Candidatus Falkowbacteria bacterium]|nr:MAG: hypothetical protein UV95_C0003G0147 [Candidatus Falkowbacteria bacterium GW2011_GWF2_43_32]HBA36515.1 hypothetical protein [Candidatus Falkowbacteria bacterium]
MEVRIGKTLYVTDRKLWRSWLAKHYKSEKEIWLVYFRKESGKPRISYNDSVEEALCYGWIDSVMKNLDEERFAQRFSVRRKTSTISQINKERIYSLIAQKKMTKAGLAAVKHVFDPVKEKTKRLVIPSDVLRLLKADKQVWANFQKFPESYKRIRVAYLESQRRHGEEQYQRALKHFIKMTTQNKHFGFVKEMRFVS